jgi:serine/threonine-protein kinase RsbT
MSAHPMLHSVPTPTLIETRVGIEADTHVAAARQKGRVMATLMGFSSAEATIVATAISELARNILMYARRGEIILTPVVDGNRPGLVITARDEGQGIGDVRRALEDGFSTSGRLGVGLPGVKRLMDEFDIASTPGRGTMVTVKKWKR